MSRRGSARRALLALALAWPALGVAAQPARPEAQTTDLLDGAQPKVVLVLSGGGARGAAHIGVLRALEELGVPIHGIIGTSMGAVVGGLYASGIGPDELERILVKMDWNRLFLDDPNRGAFRYRRKLQDQSLLVRAGSGLDTEGIKLPLGFVHGHQLKAFFNRQTLHVSDVERFSDLPVPFRAVAAELSTGEAVVMDHGSLAGAMFASMAIPAFVTPAERDGRLLVDGGVANNLPVNLALEMQPDLIIAVDASSPLRRSDELPSLLEVTEQLTTILTRNNTSVQIQALREQDLLVVPDLGGLGATDFTNAHTAVAPGYGALMSARAQLDPYRQAADAYRTYLAQQRRHRVDRVAVEAVEVQSDSPIDSQLLAARLDLAPGQISVSEIEAAVDHLYGMEIFSQVPYRYRNGRLTLMPVRKPWGPNYLQFGLGLEDDFEGRNHYQLGLAFTATELNRAGGEWRTEAYIGERPGVQTEFYQPIGRRGQWFVNPSLAWQGFNRSTFDDHRLVSTHQIRQTGVGLGLGRTLGTAAEARLQLWRAEGRASRLVGGPEVQTLDADAGRVELSFRFDSLDNLYFPREGRTAELRWTYSDRSLGADRDYRAWQAGVSQALGHARHSLVASAEYATVYEGTAPFHEAYTLGGFFNLSGLEIDRKLGQHRALGRLAYYYRWMDSFVMPIHVGASLEGGQVWQERGDVLPDLDIGGSVFVGLDSPIGPLYLAAGFAEGGERSLYVFLGQPF